MDYSTSSILIAAGVDSLLFIGLFFGFLVYRKIRSPVIEIDAEIELKKPYLHEGEYEIREIAQKVFAMSIPEVHESIGEWGYVYLTLHKYIIYTLALIGVFGCSILLSIYIYGDTTVEDNFHETGFDHISEDKSVVLAPIIFLFFYTVVLYYFANRYYSEVTTAECEAINPAHRYCVLITKIPRNFPPEFISDRIQKLLLGKYGNINIVVYTIPYYLPAFKNFLDYEDSLQKLKFYQKELETKQERPTIINEKLQKIDAIEFHEQNVEKLKAMIKIDKELGHHTNSGKAYVLCDKRKLVKEIIEFRVERDDVVATEKWKFKAASSPADIIWKNIGKIKTFSTLSKVFYNIIFLGLFLIVLTPTSFNSVIVEFFQDVGGKSLIEGIVGIYLPSLLLLIYQQLLLPEAVEFLVARESHSYRHDEISSGLRKYLFYLLFYVFLYPLLGLQFIEFVQIFFDSDTEWEDEFADSINRTGQFFTTFLVHETFVKNGWDLMVASKYFKSKAKALFATTNLEKAMAYEAQYFQFDFELAVSINVFIIACSFCVVYPLIVIPALSFFILRYWVHKHNMIAVFYVDKDSSAYPTLFSVLCGIAVAVFSMHAVTATALLLTDSDDYILIAKIVTPASFCLLVLSVLWFKNIVKKGKVETFKEKEKLVNVEISKYHHPMEKNFDY